MVTQLTFRSQSTLVHKMDWTDRYLMMVLSSSEGLSTCFMLFCFFIVVWLWWILPITYRVTLLAWMSKLGKHYSDVIMSTMVFQITSLTIVSSTAYSGADQRKHQSSASLAFVPGIHRSPVNSLHKGPVTWRMFPFDDVILLLYWHGCPNWEKLGKTIIGPLKCINTIIRKWVKKRCIMFSFVVCPKICYKKFFPLYLITHVWFISFVLIVNSTAWQFLLTQSRFYCKSVWEITTNLTMDI